LNNVFCRTTLTGVKTHGPCCSVSCGLWFTYCVQVTPSIGVDRKVFGSIRTVSDDITQKLRTSIGLHEYGL
jgi:hypothetical protein